MTGCYLFGVHTAAVIFCGNDICHGNKTIPFRPSAEKLQHSSDSSP